MAVFLSGSCMHCLPLAESNLILAMPRKIALLFAIISPVLLLLLVARKMIG